ncbi:MAG: hypothetical protein PHE54_00995, partial [Bacilli bacterium]|nr:hypothetical protein [Bacilli bacterium]
NKNIGKKENDLFLDFALLSALYLVIKFGDFNLYGSLLLIIDIPLVLSYIKKREITALVLSFLIIVYISEYYTLNIIVLVMQYVISYLIYTFTKKYKNNNYFLPLIIIFKISFFLFFIINNQILDISDMNNLLNLFLTIIIFLVECYFVINLGNYSEEIVKYHMSIKELEQEKQIRTSLFKITHEIKNPIAVCKGYLDIFDINNINHSQKYIPILKEEIERTLL